MASTWHRAGLDAISNGIMGGVGASPMMRGVWLRMLDGDGVCTSESH